MRRAIWILMAVGGVTCALMLYMFGRGPVLRGTIQDAASIPWGAKVVQSIEPRGSVYAESYYYPDRSGHFTRVFGRTGTSSFERFLRESKLDRLEGDLWNDRVNAYVPYDERGGFIFAKSDVGFGGVIATENRRVKVEGAFSERAGFFYVELTDLN